MVFLDLCSGDVEKVGRNGLSHRLLMFILSGQDVEGTMFGTVVPDAVTGGLAALSIGLGEGSLPHKDKPGDFRLNLQSSILKIRK